jgi:hypothetical protein
MFAAIELERLHPKLDNSGVLIFDDPDPKFRGRIRVPVERGRRSLGGTGWQMEGTMLNATVFPEIIREGEWLKIYWGIVQPVYPG